MKKDASFYWTLFSSTFTLSAFTFGGGYVIVPLMQKRFVKELGWITEEEMLDLVAIAQSSPGPIAVNASIIIGYRMAGIRGALLSVLGTSIPPLVIITIVSYFYLAFRDNAIINAVLLGMQAGVAAVIVNVVIDMVKGITKNKKSLPILVMILAFLAAAFTSINIVIILFVCGAIGAYTTYKETHVTKGGLNK
ncbi:chromate transporter [Carnobacterium viridans]|uniref:Chromate transporter n=1 Tax=Carnobacterium viridans TaxID=174587 RepID=A0A1H0YYA8_9LACT|nr:chromate transporter [Carnobacterium viridans]UDE94884.1 chromate transporter [Carnobacterium viridans]SDQ20163.1 chromate transporter [Carnobacterium viridans]